jgi:hypothetical protein
MVTMAASDEHFPRPLVTSRRIDYHDDPEAPRPNGLVPSVNVAVINEAGDLLLIRRTDNGNWALPGGAIDLGECVPGMMTLADEGECVQIFLVCEHLG